MTGEGQAAVRDGGWQFFSGHEARTVDSVAARIMPSDPVRPGAREAHVVHFIDTALAGPAADLSDSYRAGVQRLDTLASHRYGIAFADLDEARQDELLHAIDGTPVGHIATGTQDGTEADEGLATFFAVVWEHTIQGMFCDPEYGGNHETVGWQLVGFPGAQWGYTAEQMRPGFDSATIPIKTLADLPVELQANGPVMHQEKDRDEG